MRRVYKSQFSTGRSINKKGQKLSYIHVYLVIWSKSRTDVLTSSTILHDAHFVFNLLISSCSLVPLEQRDWVHRKHAHLCGSDRSMCWRSDHMLLVRKFDWPASTQHECVTAAAFAPINVNVHWKINATIANSLLLIYYVLPKSISIKLTHHIVVKTS